MNKLFSWFGDKNKQEKGEGGKRSADHAANAQKEASDAAKAGNPKLATKLFEESIGIYHTLGMKQEEAAANHDFARMLVSESTYAQAFDAFDASIDLYRGLSLKPELAVVLRDAGQAAAEYSNSEQAMVQLEESLALFREIGDKVGVAASLRGLGRAAHHDEDFESARNYFKQSLSLYDELGLSPHSAVCLVFLSLIAVDQDDYDEAKRLCLQSIETFRSDQSSSPLAGTLAELAQAPFAARDEHQSLDLLNAALAIYSSAGKEDSSDETRSATIEDSPEAANKVPDNRGKQTIPNWRAETSASLTLAPVAYSQDQPDIAARLFDRAAALARDNSEKDLLLRALYEAGTTGSRYNDLPSAKRWFNELSSCAKQSGDAMFEALAQFGAAEAAYRERDFEGALKACEASLELFKSAANVGRTARALTLYGQLLCEKGDAETGLKVLNESLALCRREEDGAGVAAALKAISYAARELNPMLARRCLDECLELDEAGDLQTAGALQSIAELELNSGELATAYEYSCKALSIRVEQLDKTAISESLEFCAQIAVEWGDIETALLLLSSAEALRLAMGSMRNEQTQLRFDANVDALKAEMGDPDFNKSWSEGTDLTLAEIVEEAEALLEDIEPEDDLLEEGDED